MLYSFKLDRLPVLLAYLLHTTLDWVDTYYQTVRGLLPSRWTIF